MFAAIACLTVIHWAVLAALFARWLIRRKRSRANDRRENRKENFGVAFHTAVNFSRSDCQRQEKNSKPVFRLRFVL